MAQQGELQVPGGRLYYEVDGDGGGAARPGRPTEKPALVLIHAGIANLRMWDPQVPAFAERYRVIRYDTRGFGRTSSEDVAYSNRQDLLDLLDHLGVRSAYVLGCSRGGMIALDFTLEHPERVDALVTAGSGPGGFEPVGLADDMASTWEEMERLEEAGDWEPLAELETKVWVDGYGGSPGRVAPEMRELVRGWILDSYRDHGHEKPQPQPLEPAAIERLDQVRIPVLVTWGDLDAPGAQASAKALADGITGAQRHVFQGAAHLPNLEQPETFTRVVLDFLAQVDARRTDVAAAAPAR